MSHRAHRSLWTRRAAGILICLVFGSAFGFRGAQGAHRARLSVDLLSHEERRTTERKRVILHGTPDEIDAIAVRHRLSVVRRLGGGGAVVSVNSAELTELASDSLVDHISPDSRVHLMMTVSNTSTGATQVRTGTKGLLGLAGAYPAVTGKGIGVAVLDSGISNHLALKNVVASVNFVSGADGSTDAFGHGTHVAGIIGGSATNVTNLYAGGIAPDANIVNVRVLGPDGTGTTSDVIAGMEWAIANRLRYNIRVINLSLGHPVTEPAATDPLCEAVEKATAAGIVVVAAAGNSGKTADGQHGARRHRVAGQLAVCPDRRVAQHVADARTVRRLGHDLQLARPHPLRTGRQARRRGAREQDRVARGDAVVSFGTLLRAARRRERIERLHASQRHEHGDADGQRRRRAPAPGKPLAQSGAGEAGPAVGRHLPARRRPDGGRRRQRRTSGPRVRSRATVAWPVCCRDCLARSAGRADCRSGMRAR